MLNKDVSTDKTTETSPLLIAHSYNLAGYAFLIPSNESPKKQIVIYSLVL